MEDMKKQEIEIGDNLSFLVSMYRLEEKGINAYIKYFGVENVKAELLKIERFLELKKMLAKYN